MTSEEQRRRATRSSNNGDGGGIGGGVELGELDSLLESIDGQKSTMQIHGEAILEEGQEHMVDTIDPHAVDFTPFLQSHLGTAINYHDESHLNTEHHRKLHQQQQTRRGSRSSSRPNSRPGSRAPSPQGERRPSNGSCNRRNGTNGHNNNNNHKKSFSPKASGTTTLRMDVAYSVSLRCFNTLIRPFVRRPNEEPDRMRIVIIFMLAVIAFSVYHHNISSYNSSTVESVGGSTIMTAPTILHAPEETTIPEDVEIAYRDVNEKIGMMDTPIYWHVPRSGGTTMKLIMSMCMGRVVACEQGAGHQLDEQLEVLTKPFGNFANVDTSTPLGIERAAEMGLIPSRTVDVVLTPHIREATRLFDEHHRGRLFGLFRDPIERVVSLYYFLRMPDQQQETTVGLNIRNMTLEDFASNISENWMVRSLTNTMTGPLNMNHLNTAKEILRRKFLIGMLGEKTESLRRIEKFFGWKLPSRVSQTCKNNMFYFEPQSKNTHDPVGQGSKEYEILRRRNLFDLELYEYARTLFDLQRQLIE